tara:strand:- start:66 stop:2435 length:2370 start_codon:yes stop_codon:yes gene_type:complete
MLGLANVLSATSSTDQETYSLLLDGTNDYLYASGLDGAAFPVTGSLSLWVKGDFSNSAVTKAIFDNYATSRDHFFIRNKTGSGNCQIAANGVAYLEAGNTGYIATGTFPLVDNQWNHIVVTWDTANELFKAYHNSDLKISASINVTEGQWVPDEQEVKFGVNSLGSMDETAIWDAVLDAEAVAAIYNNGRPFNLTNDFGDYDNASDLVGYWKMFDGTNDDKVNGFVMDQNAATIGPNLIAEPGFETYDGWIAVPGDGTSAIDTSFSHSGSNSWKVTYDGGADEDGRNNGVKTPSDVAVEVNTVYRVSWWSYVPIGNDSTWSQVTRVAGNDWDILSGGGNHYWGETITRGVWQKSSMLFRTASSGTTIQLSFNNGAANGTNGDIRYFDDIELVKIGGNPGITAANATFSTDTPSKAPRGYSLDLDGALDRLNLGDVLDFGTNDFVISLWHKVADYSVETAYLINKFENTNNQWFIAQKNDGTFGCSVINGGNATINDATADATALEGTWVNLIVVCDRSSATGAVIYVNGATTLGKSAFAPDDDDDPEDISISADLTIGAKTGGSAAILGNIDEVAIWTHADLSDFDAAAAVKIYAAGRGYDLTANDGDYHHSDKLVGYWRMGDGQDDNVEAGVIHDAHNPGFGAELVDNTSWSAYPDANTGVSVSGSLVTVTTDDSDVDGVDSGARLELTSSLTAGKTYRVEAELYLGTATETTYSVYLGGTAQNATLSTTPTRFLFYLVPTNTNDFIIYNEDADNEDGTWFINNVSVKELNGNPGMTSGNPVFVKLPV